MTKLTIERTLLYRSDDGEMTRYEIFKNDGDSADNIELITVYREAEVAGHKLWVRTDEEVSLDHLAPQKNMGFPTMVMDSLRAGHGRQISSAVEECNKHWSKHYA
ncbi:hypothetical protein [Pantoea septica]|uniref:hypothetical protein n=1 Tax=Pantoea septica TaxID=472695 RepID=UPI003D0139D0